MRLMNVGQRRSPAVPRIVTWPRNLLAWLVVACSVSGGAALGAGCERGPGQVAGTVRPGKLTVAVDEKPPYSVTGSSGDPTGIDVEIVKRIAGENCLAVDYVVVDPSATIQDVVSGKADVALGGWYRTRARAKVLGLSSPLYLDRMAMFSKDGIDRVSVLPGKRVGTVVGYLWVQDLRRILGADLRLYPNGVALAQDLAAGRVDVGIDGYNGGVYAKAHGGFEGFQVRAAVPDPRVRASVEPAQTALLYTLGNASLGHALDDGVARMHADGSITAALRDAGLDPSDATVGDPRLVE